MLKLGALGKIDLPGPEFCAISVKIGKGLPSMRSHVTHPSLYLYWEPHQEVVELAL